MSQAARVSAFGRQATESGRSLPFSESVATLEEVPEKFRAALSGQLGEDETPELIIHSPAFASAAINSPENLLVLTGARWIYVAASAGGIRSDSGSFASVALIELTMILLGGQLRIESVDGSSRCAILFNMVSVDLFREVAFLMIAASPVLAPVESEAAPLGTSIEQLSFKFRNALDEQRPPGQTLRGLSTWTSEHQRFSWLFFLRPAAPAGVLAVTDSCICVVTDPLAGKEKQRRGKSPHGKIATYLLRQHPIALQEQAAKPSANREFTLRVGRESQSLRFGLRVPAAQAQQLAEVLEALL